MFLSYCSCSFQEAYPKKTSNSVFVMNGKMHEHCLVESTHETNQQSTAFFLTTRLHPSWMLSNLIFLHKDLKLVCCFNFLLSSFSMNHSKTNASQQSPQIKVFKNGPNRFHLEFHFLKLILTTTHISKSIENNNNIIIYETHM